MAQRPGTDLGDGTILGGIELLPRRIVAGRELVIRCRLKRDRTPGLDRKLMAQVSLARPFEGAPGWLPPRFQRLYVQRREHRLYRLNYWLPLGSQGGPPEYWPPGRWVESDLVLHVPTGAKPGKYGLRIRVFAQDFVPNVEPSFYLADDDGRAALPLDSVVIDAPSLTSIGREPRHAGG